MTFLFPVRLFKPKPKHIFLDGLKIPLYPQLLLQRFLYSFTGILHHRACVQHLKKCPQKIWWISLSFGENICCYSKKGKSTVLFFVSRINDRKCRATSAIFVSLFNTCSRTFLKVSGVSILLEYKTLPCLLFALSIEIFPWKCFRSLLPRDCAV